ncbi:MAG: NAD-dependent epimerase/dehydratase family protein [Nibricoccus sp.]
MNRKILVTGGAGMIGSNLVARLTDLGDDVYVIDNLARGKRDYLIRSDGTPLIDLSNRFIVADLTVPGAIESIGVNFDLVYHLADVVAGIGYVFSNQLKIFRENILINSNVVDSVRKMRPGGYIYVGTACSFPANLQDGSYDKPLVEQDQYPANPESAYGWSKLMGEYEAFLLEKEHKIPVSVLSLHNVYGGPCDFAPERSQVIPALIRKAIRYPEEDFVVWGSGKQGRAFVHVDDIVRALVAAANKGLGQGLIQIGPDRCTSIAEIANAVVSVSKKAIPIKFDTSKPEGDHARYADYSKASCILGWSPSVDLYSGIEKLYQWISRQMTVGAKK